MIDLAALESSSARRLVPAGDSPIGGGVDGGGGDTAASRGGGEGDSSGGGLSEGVPVRGVLAQTISHSPLVALPSVNGPQVNLGAGGGEGGGDEGGEGGGGDGEGSQASCSMLLTGLHPPAPPPHRTTQRWLPSEQVTLTFDFQPCALHWKQTKALASDPSGVHFPGEQVLEHGVSSTPAITYGVPRRSITPSPRADSAPPQSNADAT
eukprot:scaffold8898_cov64-Phaeocystis_antarctica.AAC.2